MVITEVIWLFMVAVLLVLVTAVVVTSWKSKPPVYHPPPLDLVGRFKKWRERMK